MQQITTADPAASVGVISRAAWRRAAIDAALAQRPSVPPALGPGHGRPCRLGPDPQCRLQHAARDPAGRCACQGNRGPGPGRRRHRRTGHRSHRPARPGHPGATARAALARFRERDHEGAVGPGVHLLNGHTGKGQQFDWIIACGLEEGHLPDKRNNAGDALDEEQRVLLVILSRARHGVIATRSSSQDGRFGPYPATPSRWWNTLAASATLSRQTLEHHMNAMYPLASM